MFLYLAFVCFILCDVTDDVTGALWGHHCFSSINSDQKSWKLLSLWWPWAPKSITIAMQLDLPSSCHKLRDLTWPWTRGINLDIYLYQTKRKYNFIRCGVTRGLRWCLNFDSACTLVKLQAKNIRLLRHWPDLGGHPLTWDAKLGYQSLHLITNHTLFSRTSSSIGGRNGEGSYHHRPSAGACAENGYAWRGLNVWHKV